MEPNLTIVMYHYVRDVDKTDFPGIKALGTEDFRKQLDFLCRRYQPVSREDCLASLAGAAPLPKRALLLTFDDGYKDHIVTVLPELKRRNLKGCFFAPRSSSGDGHMLQVNKIQFVLAASPIDELHSNVCALLDEWKQDDEPSSQTLRNEHEYPNRYDDAKTAFIKRALQFAAPPALAGKIVDRLFADTVSSDETEFARNLYLSSADLKTLGSEGMALGSHGDTHRWLNQLPAEERKTEIKRSLEFLDSLGESTRDWMLAYPSGGFDSQLQGLIREHGCAMALTTVPGVATLAPAEALQLPRLDTNDFPPRKPEN